MDRDGYGLVSIYNDSPEFATYKGIRFIATDLQENLGSGDSVYYFVDFSGVSGKRIEFHDFGISTSGSCLVNVYSAPTISDNGTALNIQNANALANITSQLKIYSGPTITDNGTKILGVYVADGGSSGPFGGGGVISEVFSYRILNWDMLIEINNVSGSTIDYLSVIWDWKEVD